METLKKPFTTSIDRRIADNFRKSCDSRDIKMNKILEAFMTQFSNDEFKIVITKSGIKLEIEEK